ncbi:MAG: lipopolysaccharide biosynthesis protein [Nostocoides sp.]
MPSRDHDDPVEPGPADTGRLGNRLLASISTSAATVLISLFTGVVSARLLGADGRGQVAAVSTWLLTLSWSAALGFFEALAFYTTRAKITSAEALSWTIVAVPVLGLVGVLAGEVLIPLGFAAQSADTQRLAQLAFLGIPLVLGEAAGWELLMGQRRFRMLNAMRVAQPLSYAVGLAALAVTGHVTPGMVLLIQVASYGLCYLTIVVVLLSRGGLGPLRIRHARLGLGYGLRLQGVALGDMVSARLDVMVLPAFVAGTAVGFYAIAVNVASMLMTLFGTLWMIVFPIAGSADPETAQEVIQRGLRLALLGSTSVAVALGIVAPWLLPTVYGAEFAGAVTPLWLLLPGAVFWSGSSIVSAGLRAAGAPGRASLVQIAGIAITVAGLLLTLPRFGILGAAATSTVAYAVTFLATAVTLHRRSGFSLAATVHPAAVVGDLRWVLDRARTLISTGPRAQRGARGHADSARQ